MCKRRNLPQNQNKILKQKNENKQMSIMHKHEKKKGMYLLFSVTSSTVLGTLLRFNLFKRVQKNLKR